MYALRLSVKISIRETKKHSNQQTSSFADWRQTERFFAAAAGDDTASWAWYLLVLFKRVNTT
jgi:hypothetical protein